MKFIFATQLILIHSQSIDVSTTKRGIGQLLVHNFSSENLSLHGCICGNYENHFYPLGLPVDEVDSICNQWRRARNCLEQNNGVCFNVESSYESGSECEVLEDECAKAACITDSYYTELLEVEMMKGFVLNQVDQVECTNPNPLDESLWPDSCCGEAPTQKPYNSKLKSCIGDELIATPD